MCEQRFLTVIDVLFIFLTHVKKTNQKKRVQGGDPLVDPPGLCAFCTCGPKVVREVASQKPFRRSRNIASVLFLCVEKKVKAVGEGLGPPVPL